MIATAERSSHDAFGHISSDTSTSTESLFLFTARPFDTDSDLQNNLNRWYDLSIGRWINTDPIGFEAGDVNLYRYVANMPLGAFDPNGLWAIKRDPTKSQATACPEEDDNLRGLAKEIGLSTADIDKWLSADLPAGVTPRPITDSDLDAKFAGGEIEYLIPNTVLAFWMGDLKGLGRTAVSWDRDISYLKARGFFVTEQINDGESPWTPPGFANYMKTNTSNGTLHGVFLWGHGHPNFIASKDGFAIRHSDVVRALQYKLGLVVLNTCHGGWSGGESYDTRYWDWLNLEFVNDKGTVKNGGKDWFSKAPGGKFFGLKKTLYPVGFFNPLGWKWATLTGFAHVDEVLSANEQGTKGK
jgi:RHS repeat-associated protein